jgi:S-adenosylmethionine decarboxylase
MSAVHQTNPVGRHCLGEFYEADAAILNSKSDICTALEEAAIKANAKLLNIVSHSFEPQGITAFALLAESHISIHTWPELGYATVDAFTCGTRTNPEQAIETLKEAVGAKRVQLRTFDRDYVSLLRLHLAPLQGAPA